jgi:hypothetical protein
VPKAQAAFIEPTPPPIGERPRPDLIAVIAVVESEQDGRTFGSADEFRLERITEDDGVGRRGQRRGQGGSGSTLRQPDGNSSFGGSLARGDQPHPRDIDRARHRFFDDAQIAIDRDLARREDHAGLELDLALSAGFFTIRDEAGNVFYTRDGRFQRDAAGSLVTSAGYYVLGDDGQPITLPPGPVTITADGTIQDENGAEVARLRIRDFAPLQLARAGEAYFRPVDDAEGVPPADPGLRQGFLESSNANLVEELTSLLAVQRVYQASQAVLARLDTTLDQASGELGRL